MVVEEATAKLCDSDLRLTRRVTFSVSTIRRRSQDREDRYFVRVFMKFSGKRFLLNEQESRQFSELINGLPAKQRMLGHFVRSLLRARGVRLGVAGSKMRFDSFRGDDVVVRCVSSPNVEVSNPEQVIRRPLIQKVSLVPQQRSKGFAACRTATRSRPSIVLERRRGRIIGGWSLKELISEHDSEQSTAGSDQLPRRLMAPQDEVDEIVSSKEYEIEFVDNTATSHEISSKKSKNKPSKQGSSEKEEPIRIKPVQTDKKNDSGADEDGCSESETRD